jgi:transcriptional regulator with XRE-family HTH domain
VERGDRNISLETLEKIIDALGVLPVEIFQFDYADTEQEQVDKKQVLDALNSLLVGRNVKEVKLVHRLAKDILETINEQKNI